MAQYAPGKHYKDGIGSMGLFQIFRDDDAPRTWVEPVGAEGGDSALDAFLDFVGTDIDTHPGRPQAFDEALHNRLKALVGDVDVDLDESLSPDDE